MPSPTYFLALLFAILPIQGGILANSEGRTAIGNCNTLSIYDVMGNHLMGGFLNLSTDIVEFYYIDLITGEETPYNCPTYLANSVATSHTNNAGDGNILIGYDDLKAVLNCSAGNTIPTYISLDHDLIYQVFMNSRDYALIFHSQNNQSSEADSLIENNQVKKILFIDKYVFTHVEVDQSSLYPWI